MPGELSFTALTVKRIKKLVKITKLEGYIPLIDIRLQMCVIKFPLSLNSEP
jgi:hypothetical protein